MTNKHGASILPTCFVSLPKFPFHMAIRFGIFNFIFLIVHMVCIIISETVGLAAVLLFKLYQQPKNSQSPPPGEWLFLSSFRQYAGKHQCFSGSPFRIKLPVVLSWIVTLAGSVASTGYQGPRYTFKFQFILPNLTNFAALHTKRCTLDLHM